MSHPQESSGTPSDVLSLIQFWKDAGPQHWFAKDERFDERFRSRFLALHEAAARGELKAWEQASEGILALILLLDQFPRNAFRGTPRMYATDAQARAVAAAAIADGLDASVPLDLRVFVYLPFGHSESLADQERSVTLTRPLGSPNLDHAEGHRDIIRRFGRFPHRNAILGRGTTPDEQSYLDEGGYAG